MEQKQQEAGRLKSYRDGCRQDVKFRFLKVNKSLKSYRDGCRQDPIHIIRIATLSLKSYRDGCRLASINLINESEHTAGYLYRFNQTILG